MTTPLHSDTKNNDIEQTDKLLSPGLVQRAAAIIGLSAALVSAPVLAASTVKNIVLVHGAFTDGSSWAEVTTRLQTLGYHVTAVQNPLTSLADDVAATEKVLRRQQGSVLLVGHSWAGAVVTQAGNASNVKGIVYLSALVPDNGESVTDLLARVNAPMQGMAPDADGLIWLDDPKTFRQVMAGDVEERRAMQLAAVQQPIAAVTFQGKIQHAAWHDKPTWYLQTLNDHALPPAVQGQIARFIGAKVTAVTSSHMSLVSHPDVVVSLIDQAAKAAGN